MITTAKTVTAKLQLWAWCFLFFLWLAGCSVELKNMNGERVAGAVISTAIPCVTVTQPAPLAQGKSITITVPLTVTPALTATLPVTATPAVTPTSAGPVTLTPAAPITPSKTLTATTQPTTTVIPTRTAIATMTPRLPITPTRSFTVTLQPTPTGTLTPPPLASPTATRVGTPAPQLPTPTAAATATQLPTSTPTPTKAATPTPTRTSTPSATATSTPTPTGGTPQPTPTLPPANAVYIRGDHRFTRQNSLFVVGEVVNGTTAPIYKIRITANFFNANQQVVATQETLAYLAQTSPDQRNPFKIQLDNAPTDITRYELSLSYDDTSVVTYQDLTIISQEMRKNDGQAVAGELRNDFSENLGSVVVVVALYDASGTVVDVYQGVPRATQLAPNDTSPYEVPVVGDQPFASFMVQSQGKRAIFF